ncbi:3-oxoacyl [Dorcoceras hygrometricum]|uniref:3-oxoacyl n=1 Tax=Dorcoceras hygrometricum TaxID=472368 RepID=A0A2Z7AU53_9LAMI|nr:3-oxoacyl [Dorcoceras hygrometricum]
MEVQMQLHLLLLRTSKKSLPVDVPRESFDIADWVENADGTENKEITYQREKVSGPNDRMIVVRPAPEKSAQPSLTITGSDPASKGKETLVVLTKPTPVEEHCHLVLNSAWDEVSAMMDTFDEWMLFRKEVRIKEVSSLEHLAQIEEQLLVWGETEQVSELFERRSLIMYKLCL